MAREHILLIIDIIVNVCYEVCMKKLYQDMFILESFQLFVKPISKKIVILKSILVFEKFKQKYKS